MRWKRERVYKGKYKNYSISSKLRKEGKSNDEFETMLSNLTLEDINVILAALGNAPYAQVFELVTKIQEQAKAQLQQTAVEE